MSHQSDSEAQRLAEPLIRAAVETHLGVALSPTSLSLPGGSRIDVDGVDEARSTFVEIFARQGKLRGAQFHKVARDALKLITLARSNPNARLAIAFGDGEAAACVLGRSWLAEALKTWGVEVIVVDVDAAVRGSLLAAQARQVMVNPGRPRPPASS